MKPKGEMRRGKLVFFMADESGNQVGPEYESWDEVWAVAQGQSPGFAPAPKKVQRAAREVVSSPPRWIAIADPRWGGVRKEAFLIDATTRDEAKEAAAGLAAPTWSSQKPMVRELQAPDASELNDLYIIEQFEADDDWGGMTHRLWDGIYVRSGKRLHAEYPESAEVGFDEAIFAKNAIPGVAYEVRVTGPLQIVKSPRPNPRRRSRKRSRR